MHDLRALQEEQKGTIDGELATVLSSIALACKQIASLVTRAGISNLTGLGGLSNSSVSTWHNSSWHICSMQLWTRWSLSILQALAQACFLTGYRFASDSCAKRCTACN